MPWIADGVDYSEQEATEELIRIAREYPDTFNVLMGMAWVWDNVINAEETHAIENLRRAAEVDTALAGRVLELSWAQDGITDDEADVIELLRRAAEVNPALVEKMLKLSWVQDNISAAESHTIYGIGGATWLNTELAEKMLQKPWIQDGINRDEGLIISSLYNLVRRTDEGTPQRDVATSIIDMPFLDEVTFAEARAMMSLDNLTSRRYRDSFQAVMSHPKVQDGITDQEAKVIAVLTSPASYNAEMIPHLLDGLDGTEGVYLEERIIQLPLTGETLLTIVRTRDRTTASMDYLEHAVRFAEKFMAAPLPTNYVALYFGDATVPGYGAQNAYTHMTMGLDTDGVEEYADTVAHEVGHYYFRDSGAEWINEGTVDLLSFASEYERAGYRFERHMKNRRCDSSVKTLAASEPEGHSGCARNLGERFFTDLYRTLGENNFLQGYRALYSMRLVNNPDDDCYECTAINVHHVLEAFTANVPEDVAAKAKEVLLKWYGPLP